MACTKCLFLTTVALLSAIAYDITKNGSLEASHTGRYLKDYELLIHVKPFYMPIEENVVKIYEWCEKNFPAEEYKKAGQNFMLYAGITLKAVLWFLIDVGDKVMDFVTYVGVEILNQIPPDFFPNLWKFMAETWDLIVLKFTDFLDWLSRSYFGGEPVGESLSKHFFWAVEKTKIYSVHVYDWISRKINCIMTV